MTFQIYQDYNTQFGNIYLRSKAPLLTVLSLVHATHVGILLPADPLAEFLADTLWSLPENHKMFDGSSPACIIFGFLVDFPCARFENTWSATRVS